MTNTWYDDTLINRFESKEHLKSNHKCAVLIVGGGLAGLSLLYKLKKNNVDEVIIEENHIGSGRRTKWWLLPLDGHKIMMYY